ncbi:hypothetical protein HK104_001334 [Borealophlyctis nickersoniae]|nr:hypothetical protein HK104_001334 [Borealophlyctis nickersoniae]
MSTRTPCAAAKPGVLKTAVWTNRGFSTLVSTSWLSENLNSVKILDGSWHLPLLKRDAREEFRSKHIKNARFFDIDSISDKSINLPHMLPSEEQFGRQVGGELGISENDHVVIYDTSGIGPACRVYWTFKVFGHEKVSVLDGGLPKWLAEDRPTETGDPTIEPTTYRPRFNPSLVRNYEQIREAIRSKSEQIIDARPAPRFQGLAAEPRPSLPSGHMPGAISIPFAEVTDPKTKTLLSSEDLEALFKQKGLDLDEPIVNTCGSGVTASIIYFALEQAGARKLSVYDGSWSEYASKPESPIDDKGPR